MYIYICIYILYRYGSYPTDMRYKMDMNLFKNGAMPFFRLFCGVDLDWWPHLFRPMVTLKKLRVRLCQTQS